MTAFRRLAGSAFGLIVVSASLLAAPKNGGGKPGGGGGQVAPVSLGLPAGCDDAGVRAADFNNGTYPNQVLVVAQVQRCGSVDPEAYVWAAGAWFELGLPLGAASGLAADISDDGLAVGSLVGGTGTAFVMPWTGGFEALPKLGYLHSDAYGVSADGEHVVGHVSDGVIGLAVRWSWDAATGNWQPLVLGPGSATAVSADGAVVVGTSWGPGEAWVWTESDPWQVGLGLDRVIHDVSPRGDMLVGFRWAPCTGRAKPWGTCEYEVPVFWLFDPATGSWDRSDLQAIDGVDSEAYGVGEVDWKLVIVGYGYTKKDAVLRAVAWVPGNGGAYGASIRLAALGSNSRTPAVAIDVNANGLVLGNSGSGNTFVAVLWTLP